MFRYSRWIAYCSVLAALLFAFQLYHKTALAACGGGSLSEFCSSNYGLDGNLSTLANEDSSTPLAPEQAYMQAAGELVYADFLKIESEARTLLARSMNFRQDISPYRANNRFDALVRKFDINSGFSAQYVDSSANITTTLQARIDLADAELRRARDLYAYLAVYAPIARMRNDASSVAGSPSGNFKNSLCAQAEDPNPKDPTHSGQVKEPVIDWCDFPARMRQSVREAAYLRMIFAQQFMVDALGLHFSAGSLIGGDDFVRDEVAKLRAAQYQFQQAEAGLKEAMTRPLGSGCLVSDFYTQSEWSLFSRAIQGQEVAQHHIAVRLSYLDISNDNDVATAKKLSMDEFRNATTQGYLKLIGMSRYGSQPTSGCEAAGTRPDGGVLAEMALNMADTRAKLHDLSDGRNPLGFQTALTPDHPYKTAVGSADEGLWQQAKAAADLAKSFQSDTVSAERTFDLNQEQLMGKISDMLVKIDKDISDGSGCSFQEFNNDDVYYACVTKVIEEAAKCDPTSDGFAACMARTTDGKAQAQDCSNCVVRVSDIRKALEGMRAAWLGVKAAMTRKTNLVNRIQTEEWRNSKVNSAKYSGAVEVAVFEAFIAAANCCSVSVGFPDVSYSVNPGAFVEAALRPAEIMREAATEIKIENINSEAVIRNYFFDLAEVESEIEIAVQQFNEVLTEYNDVVGDVQQNVIESQRQRAYLLSSPANDPSYRMVRDSYRLQLAQQLVYASRLAYLAARRAEYEYATNLSGSNFRISDIYKARTADDILLFLQELSTITSNLAGSVSDAQINQEDLTIHVVYDLLGLTDQYLLGQGVAEADLQNERQRRFQYWLGQHTSLDSNGKAVVEFSFVLPAATDGIIGQVVTQGYDYFWLHKVGGIGQPKASNNGFGVNLVTSQSGALDYRRVIVSQGGQVVMRSAAGCIYDYRLVPTAILMGFEYPTSESADVVTSIFKSDINGVHGNSATGYSTAEFLGRPLGSTTWRVVIHAGSPGGNLPDLDLQQLQDVELKISTTHATRTSTTPPAASQCVRADF